MMGPSVSIHIASTLHNVDIIVSAGSLVDCKLNFLEHTENGRLSGE
jgi:hypothetical protein